MTPSCGHQIVLGGYPEYDAYCERARGHDGQHVFTLKWAHNEDECYTAFLDKPRQPSPDDPYINALAAAVEAEMRPSQVMGRFFRGVDE